MIQSLVYYSQIIRRAYTDTFSTVYGMDLSQNFDSIENARYFDTVTGESGMITDILEGRIWLDRERTKNQM